MALSIIFLLDIIFESSVTLVENANLTIRVTKKSENANLVPYNSEESEETNSQEENNEENENEGN